MELSEDEMNKKNGTLCKHCDRNKLLPFEYESTCFGCGYNLIKRKHDLSKSSKKKK